MKLIDIHKQAVRDALRETKGNRSAAARKLGVCIRSIRNWIKEYELDKEFPATDKNQNWRKAYESNKRKRDAQVRK